MIQMCKLCVSFPGLFKEIFCFQLFLSWFDDESRGKKKKEKYPKHLAVGPATQQAAAMYKEVKILLVGGEGQRARKQNSLVGSKVLVILHDKSAISRFQIRIPLSFKYILKKNLRQF